MPQSPRKKLENDLQMLKDRRRVIDRQIWALEQELAGLPLPEPQHRRRATDRPERAELASA